MRRLRMWNASAVSILFFTSLFFVNHSEGQVPTPNIKSLDSGNSGTYISTVPIEAPPGRRGLAPKLTLSYSSSGGNGFVGVGWSLDGFSIIERLSPRKGSPNYDASDIYFLDGQELISCVSPNCVTGGTHTTQLESFRRISYNSGTNQWSIWQKDGTKLVLNSVYGVAQGTFRWGLASITDTRNNTINFNWWCDPSADCYPDTVTYNGVTIKFYSEVRPDPITFGNGSYIGRTNYRLKTIDIMANGNRQRTYLLTYKAGGSPSTSRSLLESVHQFGKDATVDAAGNITNLATASNLPPISLGYQSDASYASFTDGSSWKGLWCSQPGNIFLTGDFNGDGIQDILCHDKALGSSFIEIPWTTNAPSWGGSNYTWAGDFNGDGLPDIATANGGMIWVKKSTGSGFVEETWATQASMWGDSAFTWVGDFNGDGLMDIATASGGTIWVKKSTGLHFVEETWTTTAPNWGSAGWSWVGDFNGDGLADIVTTDGTTVWVKRSTGTSFVEEIWLRNSQWGFAARTFVGDFNGDGLADIATTNGPTIWVISSLGSSFREDTWATNAPNWGLYQWVGDFNGDGLMDIGTASGGTIWVKKSTGSNFVEEIWTTTAPNWGGQAFTWSGDFNGDGLTDVATANGGTIWIKKSTGSSFVEETWTTAAPNWGSAGWSWVGDFNGDGLTDIATANGGTIWVKKSIAGAGGGNTSVALSNGSGSFTGGSVSLTNWCSQPGEMFGTGDFNGDGKTDLFCHDTLTDSPGNTYIALSDGLGGFTDGSVWISNWCNQAGAQFGIGDFAGSGSTDIYCQDRLVTSHQQTKIAFAIGNQFSPVSNQASGWCSQPGDIFGTGDFDGDGRTDFFCWDKMPISGANIYVMLIKGFPSNGVSWVSNWCNQAGSGSQFGIGDFNGDGKTDLYCHDRSLNSSGNTLVLLSNGATAFSDGGVPGSIWYPNWCRQPGEMFGTGDFNGDGKTDLFCHDKVGTSAGNTLIRLSNGAGGFTDVISRAAWCNSTAVMFGTGDFNGDGKTDLLCHDRLPNSAGNTMVAQSGGLIGLTDLLTSIANGLGGTSAISYMPSTRGSNTQLPFSVEVVSSVTTNDGNGTDSTSSYTYSGGYYYPAERDFRGFNYVQVNNPIGPNGEGTISKTWFHQGNDIAADTNNPNVPIGFMKGTPYRTHITDGQGKEISRAITTYVVYSVDPYFTPPQQVDSFICNNNGACGKQMRIVYNHDLYGNNTQEDQYGDLADPSDDRTIYRDFGFNVPAWIVSLQINESVFANGINKSYTAFYYDQVTDCSTLSTSQTPTIGNLTRVTQYTADNYFDTQMAYDSYGNMICIKEPYSRLTTISYDGSATFPTVKTDPMGHQIITQYYGIDGIAADTGLYGQVRTVTDPNGAQTSNTYDTLGRLQQASVTDGPLTMIAYTNIGSGAGVQNIQTNAGGLSTWVYFDGLGRVVTEKKTGPDGKIIVSQTNYNNTGTVRRSSLPYFDNTGSPVWKNFIYDALGRVLQVLNPDGSRTLSCYDEWFSASIDANNHKKRETRDAFSHIARVDEYQGVYTTCSTDLGAPYASTTYQYDTLGNLVNVTDAKGNQTQMTYDKLSRKTSMQDPDMGSWSYSYLDTGDLRSQTDAKGQMVYFQYDDLRRITYKSVDQLYADDFNRTTGLGLDWTIYGASTSYTTDGATAVSGGVQNWAAYKPSLGTDDYEVDVVMSVPAGSAYSGVVIRGNPSDIRTDDYSLQLSHANQKIRLYRRNAGVWTLLREDVISINPDVFYSVQIAVSGSNPVNLSVWYAGNYFLYTDSSANRILSGIPGIENYNPGVKYDSFTVLNNGSAHRVTYKYDEPTTINGIGRLTSISDSSGTTKFTIYDKMGRIKRAEKTVDGTTYVWQTNYDSLGRVTAIDYPQASGTVNYAYNGPLLLNATEGTTVYAQYSGYNALGQPASLILGNGVNTNYVYYPNNFRLQSIFTTLGATCFQSLGYLYDAVGSINEIDDYLNPSTGVCGSAAGVNTQTFVYGDSLNRLTSATGPYGSNGATLTLNYAYDQIGNMTCNSKISACSSASPNYTYPGSGSGSVRPHAVLSAGTNSYLYDRSGNMIQNAGRSITFDPYNRPVSITSGTLTTAYVYDGLGGRVKKIEVGATTIYIGNLYECINGSCSKHIFAGDQRIAIKPVGVPTDIRYFHPDHLGSSNVITDVNGAKVGSLAYYPYGQTRVDTAVNYKFNSKEQDKNTALETDSSTSLYFYGARYYDPVIGRFISADTIVPSSRDPQAFNRYTYVRNNPILYSDPAGHSWFSKHRRQILDMALQAFGGPIGMGIGTYDLSRTRAGRNILAGELVAGTAVATAYCGGCGSIAVSTLAGEVFGAYGASRSGGDYLTGVGIGGLSGLAGGAAGTWAGGLATLPGAVATGGVGGFIQGAGYTLAYGGSMEQAWRAGYQGAALGASIAVVAWEFNQVFREMTSYQIDSNGNLSKVDPKDASILPKYPNAFGEEIPGSWCETGTSLCSQIGHAAPWGDSLSWAHDGTVSYSMGQGFSKGISNYPTMFHTFMVTVGASLHEFPSAPLAVDQSQYK